MAAIDAARAHIQNYNHLKLGGAKGCVYFGSHSSGRLPGVTSYISVNRKKLL